MSEFSCVAPQIRILSNLRRAVFLSGPRVDASCTVSVRYGGPTLHISPVIADTMLCPPHSTPAPDWLNPLFDVGPPHLTPTPALRATYKRRPLQPILSQVPLLVFSTFLPLSSSLPPPEFFSHPFLLFSLPSRFLQPSMSRLFWSSPPSCDTFISELPTLVSHSSPVKSHDPFILMIQFSWLIPWRFPPFLPYLIPEAAPFATIRSRTSTMPNR